MTELRRSMVRLILLAAVVSLAVAGWASPGGQHYQARLTCSSCHVMHGSYNGTKYPAATGNGEPSLLKNDTVNLMCLQCHNGATGDHGEVAAGTAAAPADSTYSKWTSAYKNGAGTFQSDWATVSNPCAHDLGPSDATAPQGTWTSNSNGMKCTDCHDPHGSANYRNLKLRPGKALADVNVREGTEVQINPTPTQGGVRDVDNIAFSTPNNFSTWCEGCHENVETGTKHPQNVAVSTLPAPDSGAHWTAGTGAGFGTTIGDSTPGIPRVRFAQSGSDFTTCKTAGNTNQVFCLTCHKAHGSKYDSNLLWPHYTDGAADQASGCDQCHVEGG